MIAIIDYDAGNMKSVEKALQAMGQENIVTSDPDTILSADRVILPGVGAFGAAMASIRERGLEEVIRKVCAQGTPFLGICLGLQLMFEESEEDPGVRGLGLLPGKIRRIPDAPGLKIPHMGWNSLQVTPGSRLMAGLEEEPFVYFVHSYYLHADDPSDVAAKTFYSCEIHAAVEHENIFACQFHPEKSSETGLHILKNFCEV
ncbi:MAG: imidazole glycerol phosphate synthase subunit HisH [Lachnospiraceae bacterium]|nr:imidazole glycerol phosphate synthase subunit HisH [Lachnospiraceae bacterium]MBQ1516463.1 imidazole glycerol phosphate synthase subunit HisH [Lachnospiraceae bacterium]MBQ4308517.1 imidazole glycerol phosphate synthase subunit HisH [Lachnospiraceae bacterium]